MKVCLLGRTWTGGAHRSVRWKSSGNRSFRSWHYMFRRWCMGAGHMAVWLENRLVKGMSQSGFLIAHGHWLEEMTTPSLESPASFYPLLFFSVFFCFFSWKGDVVYRQKRGEEARGFSTVRGAPQNGAGRTCVRQAEAQGIVCYAMGWATWGRFFCFLRGSSSSGSAVTSISDSAGYLTSETN